MRPMTLLIAVFSLVLGMSSCSKKANVTEKILSLVVPQKVKGMDPIYASDRYSSNEVARIYEGLLEYHYLKRPYTLKPNLAAEMPVVSKDGLTYTFKIRKGVLFHDDAAFPGGKGKELTAQDFVYSIKRLADPKLLGLGWWLLDGKVTGLNEWRKKYGELPKTDYSEKVEGIQALDSHTLQFKLAKPFPQFLYSLAMPFTFVVAKEAVDKYKKEFLNHPVGTGPFVIKGGVFTQTNKITYIKNKTFREKKYPCDGNEEFKAQGMMADCGKKLPLVEKLVVNVLIEDQPRWLNFQKGKLDFAGVPKDNFDSAIPDAQNLTPEFKEKGIGLIVSPSLDVTYTAFNHDLELFSKNTKLRQAMSLAFDIKKSNKLFNNSTALPAQSVVPPGIAGFIKGYENPYRSYGQPEKLAQAKKLLDDAGFPGGKGLKEITYDCPVGTSTRQSGEYFKKQMAQIGINIRIIQNSWPELQKKITNRQVMTYGIAWGADYPDAENFLQLLYGPNKAPGANGSGYNNPEFNRLFKVAAVMQDTPERTALYEKMNRIAAEEVPWIYGVHRQTFVLKHSWLKNFVASDFDAGQASYLDIDLELKKKNLGKL
jgi:oligopeptide transport system substrate-binding protein